MPYTSRDRNIPMSSLASGESGSVSGAEKSTSEDDDKPPPTVMPGADISHPADWPTELPGADGDGPSWIVGMHREPLWSDSMQGCSPFEYCDKTEADRGHRMQKTVNPYVDKRRTFDPYAQSTVAGFHSFPWDPTKDPQVIPSVLN